jgi:hypothetical protein
MLFDPDAQLTLEEIIERAWHRMQPTVRLRYEALSARMGIPIWDVLMKALDLFLTRLEDPQEHEAFMAKLDREQCPFGKDPLLGAQRGEP